MFIYVWEWDRQSMSRGGTERGRHIIWGRLQAPSCQHRAQRRAQTRQPEDRDLSWSQTLNQLSHPGAPQVQALATDPPLGTADLVHRVTITMPGWDGLLPGVLDCPWNTVTWLMKQQPVLYVLNNSQSNCQKNLEPFTGVPNRRGIGILLISSLIWIPSLNMW